MPVFSGAAYARRNDVGIWSTDMYARIIAGPLVLLTSLATATAVPIARTSAEAVEFVPHDTSVDVLIGGRPFTTYYFDPAIAKPFLHPLRSAAGTIVTRSFPIVQDIAGEDRDEPHQRPMYFAHGDINGFDFWGEAAFPRWSNHPNSTFGRTVVRSVDEATGGVDSGILRATFDLVAPKGVLGREIQQYRFGGDEHRRVIDCQFSILATEVALVLGDTKEGTFAIRVVKALDSPPGHMLNADGATGENGIWGKQSRWVDYYGRVNGEDVGVAILDHPQNLRAPSYWHARAYGLLAANPFGVTFFTHDRRRRGAYTIPAGSSLTLRYRVMIHHGNPVQGGVQDEYLRFAEEK
jgi:methane monooxygenase PmoA-like